jgi:hypothetical protein
MVFGFTFIAMALFVGPEHTGHCIWFISKNWLYIAEVIRLNGEKCINFLPDFFNLHGIQSSDSVQGHATAAMTFEYQLSNSPLSNQ